MADERDYAGFAQWAQSNPSGTYDDFERSQMALDFPEWAKANPNGTYAQWKDKQRSQVADFPEWAKANPNGSYAQWQQAKQGGSGQPGTSVPGGFSLSQPFDQPAPQRYNTQAQIPTPAPNFNPSFGAANVPQNSGPSIIYGSDPQSYANEGKVTQLYTDPYTGVRYSLDFAHNGADRGKSYGTVTLPDGRQTATHYDTAYSLRSVGVAQ